MTMLFSGLLWRCRVVLHTAGLSGFYPIQVSGKQTVPSMSCRVPMYCVLLRELLICHQAENDPDRTLTLQNYDSICWINGKFLLTAETYFIYLNVIAVSLVFAGSWKVRFSAISCMTSQSASLKSAQMLNMIQIATYK